MVRIIGYNDGVIALEDPELIIVDDNPGDIELSTEALHDLGYPGPVGRIRDGEAAMSLLARLVHDPRRPHPGLMLLDLNMPKVHGNEVLAYMAEHDVLSDIPVVVLTTSDFPRDRQRSLALGAREYVVKPVSYDDLVKLMARLTQQYLDPSARS